MKQFEQYKDDVGFGMAVVICKDDLPSNFYRSLDFEQWKDVCEHTSEEDPFNQTTLEGMYRKAESFDQYWEVKTGFCYHQGIFKLKATVAHLVIRKFYVQNH